MSDIVTLREALRLMLTSNSPLTTLLGGSYIYWRRNRGEIAVPCVLLSDSGLVAADVPLHDRAVRVEVYHTTVEVAEDIAKLIRGLWKAGVALPQPSGWKVCHLGFAGDAEQDVEDGDVIQRAMSFRLMAYETT